MWNTTIGGFMRITKQADNYLFQNNQGEYHISNTQYDEIGKEASMELAQAEIKLKNQSSWNSKTINFQQARGLGFCEYGIKDFCEKLNLDIKKKYNIELISNLLTEEVFICYPLECIKIFGKEIVKKFGGIYQFLKKHQTRQVLDISFNYYIKDRDLHELAIECAYSTLDNFEKEYPNDLRPRKAIEAKQAWLDGEISDEELKEAQSASHSASRSASHSVSWSARSAQSAANSAACSAEYSARSAASSAANSAVYSAAYSASSAAPSAAGYSAARIEHYELLINKLINLIEIDIILGEL